MVAQRGAALAGEDVDAAGAIRTSPRTLPPFPSGVVTGIRLYRGTGWRGVNNALGLWLQRLGDVKYAQGTQLVERQGRGRRRGGVVTRSTYSGTYGGHVPCTSDNITNIANLAKPVRRQGFQHA